MPRSIFANSQGMDADTVYRNGEVQHRFPDGKGGWTYVPDSHLGPQMTPGQLAQLSPTVAARMKLSPQERMMHSTMRGEIMKAGIKGRKGRAKARRKAARQKAVENRSRIDKQIFDAVEQKRKGTKTRWSFGGRRSGRKIGHSGLHRATSGQMIKGPLGRNPNYQKRSGMDYVRNNAGRGQAWGRRTGFQAANDSFSKFNAKRAKQLGY